MSHNQTDCEFCLMRAAGRSSGIVGGGFCANCPVDVGLCPLCGVFWMRAPGGAPGKRYGVRPTTDGGGPTAFDGTPRYQSLEQRPNVVTQFRSEKKQS